MRRGELRRAIALRQHHQVCVHAVRAEAIPGYVREVLVGADKGESVQVVVQFRQPEDHDGGAIFYGAYPSLDAAIRALEEYLGAPMTEWPTATLADGEKVEGAAHAGRDALGRAISLGGPAMPAGARFTLTSPFWRSFRRDKRRRAMKKRNAL